MTFCFSKCSIDALYKQSRTSLRLTVILSEVEGCFHDKYTLNSLI